MIHYGDVQKINGAKAPMVDVITFGAPCQDLSVAGKRAGMKNVAMGDDETTRSGLFFEAIRIIKEMRENDRADGRTNEFIRPRYAVYENVPGAFSSNKGEDFRAVLEETARVADKDAVIPRPPKGKWAPAGAIMGDGWSIAWRVHDAQFWGKSIISPDGRVVKKGTPQRRRRIALVADFGGFTAPEILFERESVPGNTTESGEPGKDTTTDAGAGVAETGGCLNGWDVQSKHIQPEDGRAESLYSGECRYGGGESYVLQNRAISFQERAGKPGGGKGILIQNERTGALSTLNNQSVVYGISSYDSNAMKSANPNSGIYKAETSRTLDLNGGSPACNQGGMAVVCLEGNGSRPSHQGDGWHEGDPMYTLNSTEHHAIAIENHPADSRVKISEDGMVQTLSSRMGTGGGNVPKVMEGINGEISGTLDASYYKGCGERQGVEREAVCVGNGQLAQAKISDKVGALNCMHDQQAVLTYGLDRASFNQGANAKYDFSVEEERIGAQVARGPGAVCDTSVVRRLTPLECERLQGYPDGWTDIGDWVDSRGKTHKGDADSPRYKALGNSIALPFWQWMAGRMVSNLGEHPTMASLFDGIGGFPLVFSRCGCEPVWASEIEEFPIAVTKKRFPERRED